MRIGKSQEIQEGLQVSISRGSGSRDSHSPPSLQFPACLSLAKPTWKPEEKGIYCYSLYRLPSFCKKKVENGPKGTNKNIQYIMQSVLHQKEHNFIYFTYFCSKRLKLTSACYLIMFSCVNSGFQKQM